MPGSRKGSPNRITAQIRENIVAVFNRLGGTNAMARWARKNPGDFYRLYIKLLPRELILDTSTEVSDLTLEEIRERLSELRRIRAIGGAGEAPDGKAKPSGVH